MPPILGPLLRRLRMLLRPGRFESELQEEMQLHLEKRAAVLQESGLSPNAAARAARRRFGHFGRLRDMSRDLWLWPSLSDTMRDLTIGWRQLRRSPGFTLLAVISLAVAIGGATAAYGLIDRWLIRPLPFPDAQRVMLLLRSSPEHPTEPAYFPLSRDLAAWRESRSFDALAGAMWRRLVLTGRGEAEPVEGMVATPDFFTTLRVQAERGRTFTADDARHGSVVVLDHAFWANRLGADPNIVGQSLTLDGRPYQVIGIMSPEFDFRMLDQRQSAQVWIVTPSADTTYGPTGGAALAGIGRLARSATAASANADVNAIQRQTNARFVDALRGAGALVEPLQANSTRSIRSTLVTVAAVAGALLLIACVNLASLMVGRGLARENEFAVRIAIGSGRRRLIAQLLTESLLLGILGAVGGLVIAWFSLRAFRRLNPLDTLPPAGLGIDLHVLALTIAITLGAVFVFGLLPALQTTTIDGRAAVIADGRIGGRPGARHARTILVVSQLALTLILLVAASLLGSTIRRLDAAPSGFDPDGVAIAAVDLSARDAQHSTNADALLERIRAELRAQPTVTAVGFATYAPLFGGTDIQLRVEGEAPPSSDNAKRLVDMEVVSSDYLTALGVQLLRGRTLTDHDVRGGEPVAIINERCAHMLFGVADPVGRRVIVGDSGVARRVVGVVATTASTFFNHVEWQHDPRVYVPASQVADLGFSPVAPETWFAIRSTRPVGLPAVRSAVGRVNGQTVVLSVDPFATLLRSATQQARLRSIVLSVCAVATLLLAALGVFGVMGESVIRRRREIGIRVAVGARADQVAISILREGAALALGGLFAGVVGALAVGRVLAGSLYGVAPYDPHAIAGAGLVLIAVALLATWLPARRASQTDPVRAIRGL